MYRFLCSMGFAVAMAMIMAVKEGRAQPDQTLADIRQEMAALYVEVQRLQRELSTTGMASHSLTGTGALDRLNAIEIELQRLTAQTEEMEFRIDQIVADGTNRIGDLEFRVCELEPSCDIATLAEMPLLGGMQATEPVTTLPNPTPELQLAEQERADFNRAQEALAARNFRAAADRFAAFNQTYPGSPLAITAELRRGEALEGLGDVRSSARAYLSAFSSDQQGPNAPEALYRLGAALGRLGQTDEACVTLEEVEIRFPDAPFVADAQTAIQNLGCP